MRHLDRKNCQAINVATDETWPVGHTMARVNLVNSVDIWLYDFE